MNGLLKILGRLSPSSLIQEPGDAQARKDAIARQVVQRNAEGSVRLSQGHYRTAQQVDADFQSICEVSF